VYCLGYGLDDPGSNPGNDKIVSLLQMSIPTLGCRGLLPPGVNLVLTTVEVKNEWSSTPPNVFIACTRKTLFTVYMSGLEH
jgi:hypothetical protein